MPFPLLQVGESLKPFLETFLCRKQPPNVALMSLMLCGRVPRVGNSVGQNEGQVQSAITLVLVIFGAWQRVTTTPWRLCVL